ncbi:MAG: hypothetical protein K6F05_08345 [Succinivibrio sp.]|nr:hypothetical protein [Succinivibrio sp.]
MQVTDTGFPLGMLEAIRRNPEQYRLLQQIPLTVPGVLKKLPLILMEKQEQEKTYQCVFMHAHATSFELRKNPKLLELALVKATYSKDRNVILSIDEIFDNYEDPHEELSLECQKTTGLSDDLLSGQQFDEDKLSMLLTNKPLIIAHGAARLRPLFDGRFAFWSDLAWACSERGIAWELFGCQGRELDYLNLMHGFFYQPQRAYDYCLAALWLMHVEPEAFMQLLERARQSSYRINAVSTPFAYKDRLKELGYRYEKVREPCWYTTVYTKEDCDKELKKLMDLGLGAYLKVTEITARTRFR